MNKILCYKCTVNRQRGLYRLLLDEELRDKELKCEGCGCLFTITAQKPKAQVPALALN